MSIDPRLKERRKTVAEEKAKRNVGRLLKFFGFVVAVGVAVWVALSPWFSVTQVTTSGIEASDGYAVLASHGLVAGTPMITISGSRIEAALLDDPWVAEARVRLDWPNDVTVDVVERVPVAWVETFSGWARHDIDGYPVPSASEPDRSLPRIELPNLLTDDAPSDLELGGVLEFAATLEPQFHGDAVIRRLDGEFWANVSGYEVRLGRSVEMAAKALSLTALLAEDIPEGSVLILIAPTNPSYLPPTSDEDDNGDDDELPEDHDEAGNEQDDDV